MVVYIPCIVVRKFLQASNMNLKEFVRSLEAGKRLGGFELMDPKVRFELHEQKALIDKAIEIMEAS